MPEGRAGVEGITSLSEAIASFRLVRKELEQAGIVWNVEDKR